MPVFANNGSLFVMALTKAIIAVVIVGTAAYCLVTQIPIPDNIVEVILLIIGAYFGFSAKVYHESQRNQKQLIYDMWKDIREEYKHARK